MKSCILVWRKEVKLDYVERIMNEENDWDHVERDTVEGPVGCVSREEMVQVLNENRKSLWTSEGIIGVDCCQWGSRNSSDGWNM